MRTKYQIRCTTNTAFACLGPKVSCIMVDVFLSKMLFEALNVNRPLGRERKKMPITRLMSEICNLAYLIVENIVKEQYERPRGDAAGIQRPKRAPKPYRPPACLGNTTRPPGPPQRS